MRNSARSALTVALAVLLSGAPALASQTASTPPAQTGASSAESRDLDKIKNALSAPPALKLDDDKLRFYIQIIARQPRFEDFIGTYDLKYGPVRGAPMTHQEFLNMVTPKELYGSGGITAPELLQFALVNWLGQAIIKKGLEELREARTEAQRRAIRERIDRELAALAGK